MFVVLFQRKEKVFNDFIIGFDLYLLKVFPTLIYQEQRTLLENLLF